MTVDIVIGIDINGHHYPIFLPDGYRVVIRDYGVTPWDEHDVQVDRDDRPYYEIAVDEHTEVIDQ